MPQLSAHHGERHQLDWPDRRSQPCGCLFHERNLSLGTCRGLPGRFSSDVFAWTTLRLEQRVDRQQAYPAYLQEHAADAVRGCLFCSAVIITTVLISWRQTQFAYFSRSFFLLPFFDSPPSAVHFVRGLNANASQRRRRYYLLAAAATSHPSQRTHAY